MKKLLSWIISLSLILSMFTVPAFAAAKLTTAETNIIKAYQKTFETGDAQYLNKYKYPGVNFESDKNEKGVYCKVLNPQYSKVYDSKVKLNKLMVKGLILVTDGKELTMGNINWGVYVKTKSKKLYAFEEVSNTEDINFVSIDDLSVSTVAAIEKYLTGLYDEDTAYALMYPEEESSDDDEDSYEESEDTVTSSQSDNSSAAGKGTLSTPIELNQKHTWSETKDFLGDTITGTYSCTVKNVKKITVDELEKLGYEKSPDDSIVEYALVDLVWEVKNATLKKGTGEGAAYLSTAWDIDIWGVKTPEKDYIIGGDTFGFDGCLADGIRKVVDFKKVSSGMNESFKAEGKALLTMYKGKTNYLVLKNNAIKDYDSSFIYFKLK
ncbi:MAG: hypothetical protein K0R50_3955 [Eubacterium sp.]|nr:hypothetical protein [Eubacterium sp.]